MLCIDTRRDDGDGLVFKTEQLRPHCSLARGTHKLIIADADPYNEFFIKLSLTIHIISSVAGIVCL